MRVGWASFGGGEVGGAWVVLTTHAVIGGLGGAWDSPPHQSSRSWRCVRIRCLHSSIYLAPANSSQNHLIASTMKWLTSFLLFALLGIARALSAHGPRTLVVIEDEADKDKYSQFWHDLTGMLQQPSSPNRRGHPQLTPSSNSPRFLPGLPIAQGRVAGPVQARRARLRPCRASPHQGQGSRP